METIKANELRIGNLIEKYCPDADSSETIVVDGELIEHLHYIELYPNDPEERIRHQKFFYPIPLTEQWLLNAGFKTATESDRYGGYISPGGWRIVKYEDAFGFQISMVKTIKILYIHKLQNLIYELGEELIFNR